MPRTKCIDGETCVVCNREVKSNRRRMKLDVSEYDGDNEGYTVRVRLEQILEETLPETTASWMCDLCFKELSQIEEYYELLRRFKSKYMHTRNVVENAEKNKTNVLMKSVQSSAKKEENNKATIDTSMIHLHLPYLSELAQHPNEREIHIKKEIDDDDNDNDNDTLDDTHDDTHEDNHDESFASSTTEFTDTSTLVKAACETIAREEVGKLKKPIKCCICGETGDQSYMKKHMGDFHPNELHPLACKTCGKNFRSKKKLCRHAALHTGRRPYKCLMCPKDFNSTDHLKRHLKVHAHVLPFYCCDKVMETNEDVASHMLEHRRGSKYKCGECDDALFTSKKEYTNHIKTQHAEKYESMRSEFEVACMVCGKTFANQSKLTRHMQAHSDVAPYGCDLCEKRFKREQTLLEHKRVHSGEKPYQCSMCDKSYLAKASLQSHERTHTGEKQCLCPVCGKGFHENSYLTRHMAVHSEEKKYKCPVCGKGFKRADHVTKHMPIHTGIKPYLCNVCGAAFARLDKLKHHMHKHNRPDRPKPERKKKIPRIKLAGPEGPKPKKPRVRKPRKPKGVLGELPPGAIGPGGPGSSGLHNSGPSGSGGPSGGPSGVPPGGGGLPPGLHGGALGLSVPKTEVVQSPPNHQQNPSMDVPSCHPVIVEPPHHNLEPHSTHSSLASALTNAQFLTASHIGLMAIGAQYGTYPYGMDDDNEGKYMNVPQVDMHHHHHPDGPYNKHLGHH